MNSAVKNRASTDDKVLDLGGGVGVVVKLRGEQTRGRLAVVEHPFEPGGLIEPHTHALEDEWSYVLEGTVGVQVGDVVMEMAAGGHFFKPRGTEHAVWNPTPQPAVLLDVITPAGFEQFLEEVPQLVASDGSFDAEGIAELAERYAVSMAFEKADAIVETYALADLRARSSS